MKIGHNTSLRQVSARLHGRRAYQERERADENFPLL